MTEQSTMRAIQVHALGHPRDLVLAEVAVPQPGPGEIALDVHAAGVNFPDALMVAGKYQVKPALPFTLGVEVAGVVRALGPGVEGLRVGERVAALPKSALLLSFGMFTYEGDAEVLRDMLKSAPPPARVLLPLIAPRVYARRARRVHGTARP